MISDEAVEAAAQAVPAGASIDRHDLHEILEAAAPHMLAGLRDLVEDMECQPWSEIATVPGVAALIRSTLGELLAPNPYRRQA